MAAACIAVTSAFAEIGKWPRRLQNANTWIRCCFRGHPDGIPSALLQREGL